MRLRFLLLAAGLVAFGLSSPCESLSTAEIRESFAKNLEAKLGTPDETGAASSKDEVTEQKEPRRKLMKLKRARTLAKELRSAINKIAPEIHKVAPLDMRPAERLAAMEDIVKAATTGIAEKHGFSDFVQALNMLNVITEQEKDARIATYLREISAVIAAGEGTDPEMGHEVDEISVDEANAMMRELRDVLNEPSAQSLLRTTATDSERVRVLNRMLKKPLIQYNFHELEDAIASASAAYQDSPDSGLAALMHDVGALVSVPLDSNTVSPTGVEEDDEDGEVDSVFLEDDAEF